jgi:hypothetical protein
MHSDDEDFHEARAAAWASTRRWFQPHRGQMPAYGIAEPKDPHVTIEPVNVPREDTHAPGICGWQKA